jgi:hypothetical protein
MPDVSNKLLLNDLLRSGRVRAFMNLYGLNLVLPSSVGFSSIVALIQADNNIRTAVLFGIVICLTIIAAILGNIVKLKLGTKEITVTADKNNDEMAATLVKLAYEDIAKQREFFGEQSEKQRVFFKETIVEDRTHYDAREREIRDEKHRLLNELNPELGSLRTQMMFVKSELRSRGLALSEDFHIVGESRK